MCNIMSHDGHNSFWCVVLKDVAHLMIDELHIGTLVPESSVCHLGVGGLIQDYLLINTVMTSKET